MTTTKKFLRLPAVIEATGWSRATIWRKVKAGVLQSCGYVLAERIDA